MENRKKWTIGMAILGGILASQGKVRTPLDAIFGAGLWGGLAYGIASIFQFKKSKTERASSTSNIIQRKIEMARNLDASPISDVLKEFLRTLEIVPGRRDGWYKDPSNIYKLRYFFQGEWTLCVSDTESEAEKMNALSKYLNPISSREPLQPPQTPGDDATRLATPEIVILSSVGLNQTIEQLERIAELRRCNMINEVEHERLKRDILKNVE